MKLQGTKQEIEFIKNFFAENPCINGECIYSDYCSKHNDKSCSDVIKENIEFEEIK